jgi:hypothetical protein
MDYAYLLKLKQQHPALRLLNADSAPLIISFLYRVFIRPNARALRQTELAGALDDYLYQVREAYGAAFPRAAQAYLDDWASGDSAYLRKYYPPGSDEPEYDLTPATEKVIEWIQSLSQRQFVGTESRLLTIYQLLREIVHATETDPHIRIADLEEQKAALDVQIAKLRDGRVEPYNPTQVKERFLQAEEGARRLLADFRQVEENFRWLDRETRERIAMSVERKGLLLDEIFNEHHAIANSDQGRSFRAFWTFLMSPGRQDELNDLVRRVLTLQAVQSLVPDELLPHIKFRLMEAGEKVQQTSASLVEQLRRFLDDQVWLENKRIAALIHDVERHAIAVRQQPPAEKEWMALDDVKPAIALAMTRSLYVPTEKPVFDSAGVEPGQAGFSTDALFAQHHVDEAALRARIRRMLAERSQVSLVDVITHHPVAQGLSEVVAYLHIACQDPKAVIDAASRQELIITTEAGAKTVTVPSVIFTR